MRLCKYDGCLATDSKFDFVECLIRFQIKISEYMLNQKLSHILMVKTTSKYVQITHDMKIELELFYSVVKMCK